MSGLYDAFTLLSGHTPTTTNEYLVLYIITALTVLFIVMAIIHLFYMAMAWLAK
jgi:hypothetical protein